MEFILNILALIAEWLLKQYCEIFKPYTVGVKAVVFARGKVVLVQKRGSGEWVIPGGGFSKWRDKTVLDGMIRELYEETSIAPKVGELKLFKTYFREISGKKDEVHVFSVWLDEEPLLCVRDMLELKDINTFAVDCLPTNIENNSRAVILNVIGGVKNTKWLS